MKSDMSMPGLDDVLWTADDVARYLKASRSWVYQKADAGLLPCLRIGGLLRFDPEAVRAFVHGGLVARAHARGAGVARSSGTGTVAKTDTLDRRTGGAGDADKA